MNVSIEGIDGVLNQMQDLISEGRMQHALAVAGEVVRADAAANAPVGDTGRLAGSITCNVEGNSAIIGSNLEYALSI